MKSLIIAASIVAIATFQAIGQPKYTNNSSSSSLSISSAKGSSTIDANYKHQAGVHKTETNANTIKMEQGDGHDSNYKHQAGRHREGKKHAFIVKASPARQRNDGNYKHQFPSN